MRRNRSFWLALVLFLGLAAWIRYFESRRPTGAGGGPAPFLAVEPVRVRAITAVSLPDSTRLERREGAWRVVWPVDSPADPVAVEALLSRCRNLPVIRRYPAGEADLARYGFTPPRAVVRLELTDGSRQEIQVGAPAPATPAFYVRVVGQAEVGLLQDGEVDSYFRRGTAAWRRPELLLAKAGEITSIDLASAGRHVRLVRADPRQPWHVELPFPGAADATVITDYCRGLLAMKARSFPDDRPASLGPYGLEAPAATIELGDGGGRRFRLDLGAEFPGLLGPERYARVEGQVNILGVPAVYLDVARREDSFFRDRRIFRAGLQRLARLLVMAGSDTARLEPDSTGAWRLGGEMGTPGAPPPDRRALVEAWVLARADSVLPARGAGAPRPDWRRPRLTVEVVGRDGVRERLEVGPPIAGLPDERNQPARLIEADPPRPDEVFLLDSETVRLGLALLRHPEPGGPPPR